MTVSRKLYKGNSIPRFVFVGVSMAFQVGWLLLLVLVLNDHYQWLETAIRLLSLAVILHINGTHTNSAYKMPWIMLILAAPVMGLSLYLMLVIFADLGSTGKRMQAQREQIRPLLPDNPQTADRLAGTGLPATQISRYLHDHAGCPVYENTLVTYLPEATAAFDAMKADLEGAQSSIYMEYFIVSADSAFSELAEILTRKARQGVDVRLMYDDFGSVGKVNMLFARQLADAGIRCMVFNPALPVLNLFMNHRDHRKITVIDGRIGYTGGYNLADEYFDRKIAYGKWKDTGIRMEGDAVSGLSASFLEMWNACVWKDGDIIPYSPVSHAPVRGDCFLQPYSDDPLSTEHTALNVYLHLIASARESLYITTPYLIITDEMTDALVMAAKRGVDVRIITPGVPDKRIIYAVTRSYYAQLASQGVQIFEYTPGFCHAKQILCDRKAASIGTSNLDYRSLYLHFENNVLLWGGQAVEEIGRDFDRLFPQCREMTEQYGGGRSAPLRLWQYFLRLFSPLL